MKKIMLLLLVISFILETSCNSNSKIINKGEKMKTDLGFDPICGDSLSWHIHLQDGFDKDTIIFTINDSPLREVIANTGNNGCTDIFITHYSKEGKNIVFLKNMPSFNLSKEIEMPQKDSIKINFSINGNNYLFQESLKYKNYFGLNFNDKTNSISSLAKDSCFGCW